MLFVFKLRKIKKKSILSKACFPSQFPFVRNLLFIFPNYFEKLLKIFNFKLKNTN